MKLSRVIEKDEGKRVRKKERERDTVIERQKDIHRGPQKKERLSEDINKERKKNRTSKR